MHPIQQKILNLSKSENIARLTLRDLGSKIGESHPQKIKHHLSQLEKKGLLRLDKSSGISKSFEVKSSVEESLVSIPILGTANCGPATFFAEDNCEGFLRVSPKVVRETQGIFALKASGSSMNKADIFGDSIEEGDYVIVDSKDKSPNEGEYIVSVMDDSANIKKFRKDKERHLVILQSESTQDIPPIFIHEEDLEKFFISGKVIQVIKKF
ncbi:MAG TPA: S24 family peptidase [Candidatus Dojkabacteria bacterium]